jgi:hypothetical protein
MLWLCLPIFSIALALRVAINKGQVTATPDEKVYSTYAYLWRAGKKYSEAVENFLSKPGLEIPPTRYGFFAVSALVNRGRSSWTSCFRPVIWISAVFGALAAPAAYLITADLPSSLLVASSPLSLILSRKALQDTFTALFVIFALWGVCLENVWVLGASIAGALASREAVLLYLPALFVSWGLKTGHWMNGGLVLIVATGAATLGFYGLGGRHLVSVFRKLRQPTAYVRRFQSGPLHRLLVDLMLVSPLTVFAALTSWAYAPIWLTGFVGIALMTHSLVTPKNVRFLLIVDLAIRMMCAFIPGPVSWGVLLAGLCADFWVYRAVGKVEDPVTVNLVARSRMYFGE